MPNEDTIADAVHVKAKPIPKPPIGNQINEATYRFIYYYPQYTLEEALELPFYQILACLQVARREKAAHYLEMLNISAAPHTKKGQGVKSLSREYKRIAEGYDG